MANLDILRRLAKFKEAMEKQALWEERQRIRAIKQAEWERIRAIKKAEWEERRVVKASK